MDQSRERDHADVVVSFKSFLFNNENIILKCIIIPLSLSKQCFPSRDDAGLDFFSQKHMRGHNGAATGIFEELVMSC